MKKKYRYTTFENMGYLYSGAAKWQPLVIVCTLFFALAVGLKDYVWIYGGKKVIEVLENLRLYENLKSPFYTIVKMVIFAAIIEGLLILIANVTQTTVSSRITDIRCKFVLMTNRKIMKMPYVLFDNTEAGEIKRKCDASTANMTEGVEGLLREAAHFFSQLIMLFMAAGILLYLNPVLVVILLVLAFINGMIHNRMNRYEKEEFRDKMIPNWRESYYYYQTSSNA